MKILLPPVAATSASSLAAVQRLCSSQLATHAIGDPQLLGALLRLSLFVEQRAVGTAAVHAAHWSQAAEKCIADELQQRY